MECKFYYKFNIINKMSETTYLNGYKIYPFKNREGLLDYLANGNLNKILFDLNAGKLEKEDQALKKLVNDNIRYPEGTGPVAALKQKKIFTEKIAGTELWLDIVHKFYKDKTFYLVGGKQEIIEITVLKLQQEFPGIQIVNHRNGDMNFFEQNELMDDVAAKKPDIVFVAMGSPKQEFLMQDMLEEHEALYMGLDGSFDIYAGIREHAPGGLQNMGMEWSN